MGCKTINYANHIILCKLTNCLLNNIIHVVCHDLRNKKLNNTYQAEIKFSWNAARSISPAEMFLALLQALPWQTWIKA